MLKNFQTDFITEDIQCGVELPEVNTDIEIDEPCEEQREEYDKSDFEYEREAYETDRLMADDRELDYMDWR